MRTGDLKMATAVLGAVEAFVTFIILLGHTIASNSLPMLEVFMAILIMLSGLLMFITCFGD